MKKIWGVYLVAVVIVALALMGCASPAPPLESRRTITAEQLVDLVHQSTPPLTMHPKLVLLDREYKLPTRDWVLRTFAPAVRKFLFDNRVQFSAAQDCDNFTLYGVTVANLSNRGTGGVAVGSFIYVHELGVHAVNVIFTDAGVIYFEPQSQSVVELPENYAPLAYLF